MRLGRTLGSPSTEALALINLAESDLYAGDAERAVRRSSTVADLSNLSRNRDFEAAALSTLGIALIRLGRPDEARVPPERAVELFEANGSIQYVCTPTAALAHVEQLAGHGTAAVERAARVVAAIERGTSLTGIDHPYATLLTTYQVLAAHHDRRAQRAIDLAVSMIESEAAWLAPGEARDRYLHHAPGRRAILEAAGRLADLMHGSASQRRDPRSKWITRCVTSVTGGPRTPALWVCRLRPIRRGSLSESFKPAAAEEAEP